MMQKLNYIRCGDYCIPDIRLPGENRPIGRWGRMYRDYIKEHPPIRFNDLCLSGELWTYLADLNEQTQTRLELIIEQMKVYESVTEGMKQHDQMSWIGAMNSIHNRAEEIILREMIYEEDTGFHGFTSKIKLPSPDSSEGNWKYNVWFGDITRPVNSDSPCRFSV